MFHDSVKMLTLEMFYCDKPLPLTQYANIMLLSIPVLK